jgi:hypothetical protein
MKAINLTLLYPKEINWFLRDKIQNIFLKKKHRKSANYLKILIHYKFANLRSMNF